MAMLPSNDAGTSDAALSCSVLVTMDLAVFSGFANEKKIGQQRAQMLGRLGCD